MSKLWVVKDIDESKIMCKKYKFGDFELIESMTEAKNVLLFVVDSQAHYDTPIILEDGSIVEEIEEFYGAYFGTVENYKYLKNNKLNRKLYECLAENGDYFVGRKV